MGGIRRPAVAGAFYPADPDELRASVEAFLADVGAGEAPGPEPKAVVAPHAGYVFSGRVAARAYRRVRALRGRVERVVLAGPGHRFPRPVVAVPSSDAMATPLGILAVDTARRDQLVGAGLAEVVDEAHADEHSIEVHLPFVQVALGDVTVLPLVVGPAPTPVVADALDAAWGGGETLVVVSTDLSHYHDQVTATRLDRRTAAAITAKRPESLGPEDACGVFALEGLLEVARRHALDVELLDLRTSADSAGPAERVVGYGAFALS